MNSNNHHVTTMYETVQGAAELNKVPGFNPLKFLRRTVSKNTGEEVMTLELPYKKLWFRLAYPKGRIRLIALHITEQLAIYEAQIYLDRSDTQPIGNFTATCTRDQAPDGRHVQAAQEEALNEALSDAGFGIQFSDASAGKNGNAYPAALPAGQTTAAAPINGMAVNRTNIQNMPVQIPRMPTKGMQSLASERPAQTVKEPQGAQANIPMAVSKAQSLPTDRQAQPVRETQSLPADRAAAQPVGESKSLPTDVQAQAIRQPQSVPANIPMAVSKAQSLPTDRQAQPVREAQSLPTGRAAQPVREAQSLPAEALQSAGNTVLSAGQLPSEQIKEALPVAEDISAETLPSDIPEKSAGPALGTAAVPSTGNSQTAASGNNTVLPSESGTAPETLPAEKNAEPGSRFTKDTPVEEIMKLMTYEEACQINVDVGTCQGNTVGYVAEYRTPSLKWLAYAFKGNNILNAAARIMIESMETKKAG